MALIDYLPTIMKGVREFKIFLGAEDPEVDDLKNNSEIIIDDSFFLTTSETRIIQWEQALNIKPYGTLPQRKSFLLSYIRGQGKLNEARIKSIVEAFTGGDSIITFNNSTIRIQILTPPSGDVYRYPDVERALIPKKPAHLGLKVERWYATWNDIKTDFTSWDDVTNLADWSYIKNHIPT